MNAIAMLSRWSTNPPDRWRVAFAAMMAAAVFCSDTPQDHLVTAAATALSLAVLAGLWLLSPSVNRNTISGGFALLLIAIAISLPVSMHYGTALFDWALRGAAPLSFLAAFLFVRIRTPADAAYVARVILACTALWAVGVGWELSSAYRLLPVHRWTVHSGSLKIPYNVAGIAIILFHGRVVRDAIALPLLFVLLLLTLGAGYRSQFILVAVMLVAWGARQVIGRQPQRSVAIVGVAVLAIAAFAAIRHFDAGAQSAASGTPSCEVLGERAMMRGPFNFPTGARAGDTGRAMEKRFAIANFLDAPILGKGLAFAIPSNLIFAGQDDYLRCLETLHGKKYPYVYYLHDLAAYAALTMGGLGLVCLGLIAAGALSSLFGDRIAVRDLRVAAFVGLAALGLFSLISASYTLLQFNLLVASLAAILAAQTGRFDGGRNV